MLKAADREQVTKRHLDYAHALTATGVQWRDDANDLQTKEAMDLISREVLQGKPTPFSEDDGLFIVVDQGGVVIAAVTVHVAQFGPDVVVFLRHMAVTASWRGRGVGTVTVGALRPNIEARIGRRVNLLIGNCSTATAAFYAAAGLNVLEENQDLPITFGRQTRQRVMALSDRTVYSRFMFG